jgi:hypothetical protein
MLEKGWRFCPYCEEKLGAVRRREPELDEDVRRDRKGTSVILIILAILGGFGLLSYASMALSALAHQEYSYFLILVLGLLFLGLISTGIVFWRSRDNPGQVGFARVIVGTLALMGGLLILSCLTGLAVFIYWFVVCLTSGGRL